MKILNLEENMNSAVKPRMARLDDNPNRGFAFLLLYPRNSEGAGKTKGDQSSGNHFDKQWTDDFGGIQLSVCIQMHISTIVQLSYHWSAHSVWTSVFIVVSMILHWKRIFWDDLDQESLKIITARTAQFLQADHWNGCKTQG